jgi:HlyD family secretion protein
VASATAKVQKAALERAAVTIGNAQSAKKMGGLVGCSQGRQDEVERDLQRKLELARLKGYSALSATTGSSRAA